VVRRRSIGDIPRAVFLVLLFTLWLVPTLMMIGNSLSSDKDFSRKPPTLLPQRFSLENYKELLGLKLLPRWIANTAIIVLVHVVGTILINGAAGYVFAFHKRGWARGMFWLFMAPIFVSQYVLLVPQFVVFGKLGMIGLPAVILPGVWSTGIFLFRNYFRSIPVSFVESARIDGASEWRIFWKIILPLSSPIVASSAVLIAMGTIGSYLWPMLNLRVASEQTYLVGLMASTLNVYAIKNVGRDMAIGVLAMLPYLLIFSLASKYFVGGLTGGGLKE
jgi:ABC-type glycerol-3-phosphate transport system permease component